MGVLGPTHGGDDDDDDEEAIEEKPKLKLEMKNLDSDNNVRDIINEIISMYKKSEIDGSDMTNIINQIKSINLRWHKQAIFQLVRSTVSNPSSYYSIFDISFSEFVKYTLMFYIDKGWNDDLRRIVDDGELDLKVTTSLGNGFSGILTSKNLPKKYIIYIQTMLKSMLKNPGRMFLGLYYLRFIGDRPTIESVKQFLFLILPGSSAKIQGLILYTLAKVIDDEDVTKLFINQLKSERSINRADILRYLSKNKTEFSKVKDKFQNILLELKENSENDTILSYINILLK